MAELTSRPRGISEHNLRPAGRSPGEIPVKIAVDSLRKIRQNNAAPSRRTGGAAEKLSTAGRESRLFSTSERVDA